MIPTAFWTTDTFYSDKIYEISLYCIIVSMFLMFVCFVYLTEGQLKNQIIFGQQ